VAEGVNGLTFDWADVETLTNHLHTLATDRALARRMGAASRKRALASDWDAAATKYLDLFAQMTGSIALHGHSRTQFQSRTVDQELSR
jgi:glycosyltransferase involved in cell wall biosynthesis